MADWQALKGFVAEHQCKWPLQPDSDSADWGIHLQDPPPHNRLLGPVFPRGKTCGLVEIAGRRVYEWGDTNRADMTFSVTKTYLSLVAGKAYESGLFTDLDQPVLQQLQQRKLPTLGFDSEQNATITWRQMMQFTSEWQGECFGVPDQVDHYRIVGMQQKTNSDTSNSKGQLRVLEKPGTHWEYNDVRINQFSLVLMHLFQRALPDVLDELVMQPLELAKASPDDHTSGWQWHGYENSWVEVSGKSIQSVPGGGHWGGGMVISAEAQAAIAKLVLPTTGSAAVSKEWRQLMVTPCEQAPYYGFFTWLNTDHCVSKSASTNTFFAMGVGGQMVLHDADADLLAVYRWIDSDHTSDIIEMTYNLASSQT